MADLIADIDAFLDRTGMSATAFGKGAIGDPCLVPDLKNEGRRLWPETQAKVRAFMKRHAKRQRAMT